jgi:hypothetical protein
MRIRLNTVRPLYSGTFNLKIITWNCCRGHLAKKLPLLESFGASLTIVQECARPAADYSSTLWFGDNPRLGMAVTASDGYRISLLPSCEVPRYTIPIQVTGPQSFLLLAVWAKTDMHFRYVKGIIRAVDCLRDLIVAQPTVVVGDFNSNKIWDYKRPSGQNHSGLVRNLEALGLVSAYHRFHGEAQGAETRPTLHLLKQRARPYHIDYCFIPEVWVPYLQSVEVGTYDSWARFSDHSPLLVNIALPGEV